MTTRLILGDCLEVMKTLADGSVDAVVTDPPYLLGAASARRSADKPMGWADINNAAFWYRAWMTEAWRVLLSTGACWIFANWRTLPVLQCAAAGIGGMYLTSVVVWDKDWPGVGSLRGLRQHYELICLFACSDFAIADRSMSDIWRCKWTSQRPMGHPQEKPVELTQRMLSLSGPIILDPFMGSGTTGVACVQTGRNFIGIEIEPKYFEIAQRRIAEAEAQLRLPL